MIAKGEGPGGGVEFGINRHKLAHIKWIKGNVLAIPRWTVMEESMGVGGMRMCVNHFVIQQKLTQHWKSATLQFFKKGIRRMIHSKIFHTLSLEPKGLH